MLQGRTSPGMTGMMAGMLGMGGVDVSAATGQSPDAVGRCDYNGFMTTTVVLFVVFLRFVCGDYYLNMYVIVFGVVLFLLISSESFRIVSFDFCFWCHHRRSTPLRKCA